MLRNVHCLLALPSLSVNHSTHVPGEVAIKMKLVLLVYATRSASNTTQCLFLGVLDTVITFVDQNMKTQAYSVGIRRYIRKHAESQYTGKKVSKNMSQRRAEVNNCAVDTT